MNVIGYKYLHDQKFNVNRETRFFRKLSELSNEVLSLYNDEKRSALVGVDDRLKITASPYHAKDFRIRGFRSEEISLVFEKISKMMDDANIPVENRLFFICNGFHSDDVWFSGHILSDEHVIHIDLIEKNRPSIGEGSHGIWSPSYSCSIKLVNGIPLLSQLGDSPYKEHLLALCRDALALPPKSYLDFTVFNDQKYIYHDLFIMKE